MRNGQLLASQTRLLYQLPPTSDVSYKHSGDGTGNHPISVHDQSIGSQERQRVFEMRGMSGLGNVGNNQTLVNDLNTYVDRLSTLTEREQWTLFYTLQGYSVPHIARKMFFSESIVKKDLQTIYEKLGTPDTDDIDRKVYTVNVYRQMLPFEARSFERNPFSELENKIFGYLSRGLSNTGISMALNMSPIALKNYVTAIYDKLGFKKDDSPRARASIVASTLPKTDSKKRPSLDFTDDEFNVAFSVCNGDSTREICEKWNLAERAVFDYLGRIFEKLHIRGNNLTKRARLLFVMKKHFQFGVHAPDLQKEMIADGDGMSITREDVQLLSNIASGFSNYEIERRGNMYPGWTSYKIRQLSGKLDLADSDSRRLKLALTYYALEDIALDELSTGRNRWDVKGIVELFFPGAKAA